MAKRSELVTEMFQRDERAGRKRDTFDNPEFKKAVRKTRKEGSYSEGIARAMEAERKADVARAKRKGLSDLTALQDRDYLDFQRKPGGYAEQTEDVRRYELRTKLPRTAGIGGKAKGGKVSSASKRADGCAVKGKTKGKMV
jgi:hypothetical protein